MDTRCRCSRILIAVGLVLLLIGVPDPLEGAFFILPGVGLITIGALVAKSQYADVLCWAVVLVSVGIGAMIVLTWMGGVGGNSCGWASETDGGVVSEDAGVSGGGFRGGSADGPE